MLAFATVLATISSPVIALQVEFERARQVVEKKDEQLNASRRILEEQEDELLVSFVDRGGAFLYCVDSQSFGFETWVHCYAGVICYIHNVWCNSNQL